MLAGWGKAEPAAYAVGYVYLPALVGDRDHEHAAGTRGGARGACLAGGQAPLRFATMLFCLGAYMLWKATHLTPAA